MDTSDLADPSSFRPADSLGQVLLGRYRVEKILGSGGMGEVLLAQDQLLHRSVALKRLRAGNPAEGTRRSAILREARRASRISDRRIAAIYDVLDLGDDVLIVMEYVEGSTLRVHIGRPLPLETFWNLSRQCVEAVSVAHVNGLIHRDIKPENLMVSRGDEIKILDFGLAKRVEGDPGQAPMAGSTTTHADPDLIAGTPLYMAPEAHYGGKIDERTDIFSLGVVFYELLSGRHPFAEQNASYDVVLDRVMNTLPAPLAEVNPAVTPELSSLIARMLAKDPAQRFSTCTELIQDMDRARAATPAAPLPVAAGTQPRISRRLAIGASAIALVALAAFGAWWEWLAPHLPSHRLLAVLAPTSPGADEDFAHLALGAVEMLNGRLQRHQDQPGFQVASFQEGLNENVRSAAEARRIQGANLALTTRLEQLHDGFRARLELWDTARARVVSASTFEAPLSKPFEFLDGVYRRSAVLAGLAPRERSPISEYGVRGAGTLRFLLQGIGRVRSAKTEAEARRAVDDLELACRTEPEAATARAWLANAELKTFTLAADSTWLTKAETSAREAVALDSNRAEAHRALAMVVEKKDNRAALAELKKASALNPNDDEACLRLGRTYARLGDFDQERETYLSVIARRPHCWQPYWWLATWYRRQGNVDASIQQYEEMIRRAPELEKGYSNLGGLLVLRGDYGRAIDTLRVALGLRPTKAAFDNLGTAFFNSGRLAESIDAYNQSFQFGFASYESWLNLGDAYYWLRNRKDQAREAYEQAIRLGREDVRSRSGIGHTFDPMIPANLATVFPKLGQPDSARAYLRRALEADSANSMIQCCAALTCWQLDEKPRGLAWLEQAVRGGYPVAWLRDSPVFQPWRSEPRFQALIADASPQAHAP